MSVTSHRVYEDSSPQQVRRWLAVRPEILREPRPWWVVSFGSLEGLDTDELTALGIRLGHFTKDSLAENLPNVSRGDLVALMAGAPWTAHLRRDELESPPDVPGEEVVWWLEDLLDLLELDTEQELIDHVRDTLPSLLTIVWSDEDALRVDVLGRNRVARLDFAYPFSLECFTAALRYPFDDKRYAWWSPLTLKQYAVDIGYALDIEQLDGYEVSDMVGWYVSRDIGFEENDDDENED